MTKIVEIDSTIVNNFLDQNDFNSLSDYLNSNFKKDLKGYTLPEESISVLKSILQSILSLQWNDNVKELIKTLFRGVRNCAVNETVQDRLSHDLEFLILVKNIVIVSLKDPSSYSDCLKIVLQFLVNLIVLNQAAAQEIFKIFKETSLDILQREICVYETSALLHNLSLHNDIQNLGPNLYSTTVAKYETFSGVEFLHFLLENFLEHPSFWSNYPLLSPEHRIIILEVIKDNQIKGRTLKIATIGISILTSQFSNSSDIIFQTIQSSSPDIAPYEVSLMLEVLASFCSHEQHLKVIQTDKDFLINAGVLLINIHRLGKQSENYFTAIEKLAEIREPNEVIREHPAFGFKVGLIRIIGNMCWKNTTIQDLVREAELIPVILDCCNIDARNPFIMQWVILAIRNLCENNRKNQELIAGLHKTGTVSTSTLEEMGLTLDNDGTNSIKIVPLDALRK